MRIRHASRSASAMTRSPSRLSMAKDMWHKARKKSGAVRDHLCFNRIDYLKLVVDLKCIQCHSLRNKF